jgi:hypothetical protein
MPLPVAIRSYDAVQSGSTNGEAVLTASAVRTRGIKKLFSMAIGDDPRLEAQPLAVAGVRMADDTVRNVIFQASMANVVHAFDADSGTSLWSTTIGKPIKSTTAIDMNGANTAWGILSTPTIDPQAGILYACAWTSPDGDWNKGAHILARLRLSDGKPVGQPLSLEGAIYDPPGLPQQEFVSSQRKQRAGLTMVNGHIVIAFGTIQETAQTARGWLIAVDAAAWTISATWCSTVTGAGGGIWQSGAAPSIAPDGSIYVITGNGAFGPERGDFGESIVKLHLPSDGSRRFRVSSWWTPWTDEGRVGGDAEGEGDVARPSNFQSARIIGKAVQLGLATATHDGTVTMTDLAAEDTTDPPLAAAIAEQIKDLGKLDWSDQDFGSGGPVYSDFAKAILACGKDGILYTGNAVDLGSTAPAALEEANAAANYAKLCFPPILYTYFDPIMQPAATRPENLNWFADLATHHLHGSPTLWESSVHGWLHFAGGENGALRAWSLAADGSSTYLAESNEIASAQQHRPFGGMPGWSPCLASNQGDDGIIIATIPYLDSNMPQAGTPGSPGRFLVYDAQNFVANADGSKRLELIWDSQDWGPDHAFTHPKFNRPVIWNGKIYRPTYDGRIDVYGLA